MKTKLSNIELEILAGCVADLAEILSRGTPSGYGHGSERIRLADARDGYVICQPGRWLHCDTSDTALRMRVSRAYASLERRGLVERIDLGSGRCTHLAPTPAGKQLAATLRASTDG